MRYFLLTALFTLFSSLAHADIIVYLDAPDGCSQLAGHWTGHGSATAARMNCAYKGSANVRTTNDATRYDVSIVLNRDSSNVFCPEHEEFVLPLVCRNGEVRVDTAEAHLKGNLNEAGNAANFNGTVTFTVAGFPVTAKVNEMALHKQ